MEIRAYLNFIQRRWKIIIPLFLATLAVTVFITLRTQPVYESYSTYIVRISPSTDEKNSISALNTLVSSDDIPATYAKVANSRLIKTQAAEQLGLTSSQRSGLTSNSQLIAGTNVIEVSAKSHDPVIAMNYANELGNQMLNYAVNLYGSYELIALDEATQPRQPISPDIYTNLFLGFIFGLSLGVVTALVIEYWQKSLHLSSTILNSAPGFKFIEGEKFIGELEKAIAASKTTDIPVSVALFDVNFQEDEAPDKDQITARMTSIAEKLESSLQNRDRISIYQDTTLAFLMPDTNISLAKTKMTECIHQLEKFSFPASEQTMTRVNCIYGISSYEGSQERELMTASELLETAQSKMKPKSNLQTRNKRDAKHIPITTSP